MSLTLIYFIGYAIKKYREYKSERTLRDKMQSLAKVDIDQRYYVTTPIFYASGAPHVGHLYTLTLTDAIARYQKTKKKHVVSTTGTDEHGPKIQQVALQNNEDPKNYCDQGFTTI